jgi:nucleotide-binding universal stress UspA family protein
MRRALVPTDLSAAGWLVTGAAASWGERKFSAWLPYPANERCRTLVVVGDTADAIIEVTQVEGVDLIIMRAPKRRWCALLAGSVTDTVMR